MPTPARSSSPSRESILSAHLAAFSARLEGLPCRHEAQRETLCGRDVALCTVCGRRVEPSLAESAPCARRTEV